jgi:hypothetical protein
LADIYKTCHKTISILRSRGHAVSIITCASKKEKRTTGIEKRLMVAAAIQNVYHVENFDYSDVTQHNVNLLTAFVKSVSVFLILSPYFDAVDKKLRILGQSSILAYRDIPNILMYEVERNRQFKPSVVFHEDGKSFGQVDKTDKLRGRAIGTYASRLTSNAQESFQSHRIIILDENGMFL